jgi:hypothetical protein
MFKIKVEQLNHRDFIGAVKKLSGQKLPFKHSWHLKGLVTKLDKAMDTTAEMYKEIINRNAVLDEKGNLVPMKIKEDIMSPDGKEVMRKAGEIIPNSYTPKEENSAEVIKKETAELMETELEIEHRKISFEALERLEISAEELDLLEPILMIPKEVRDNVIPMNK